ncbi:MAG: hypothetical protein AMXMBFR23_10420 [Chloroflexota bacterium]
MVSAELEQRIREWIAAGMSDEQIAVALTLSVKVVRLVRRDLEAALRPRFR